MRNEKKSSLWLITSQTKLGFGSRDGTYRAIQLSFVIHPQIESTVHPSNAYQPNSKAYEFQNTCRRITQLFSTDLDKDERILSKNPNNSPLTAVYLHNYYINCYHTLSLHFDVTYFLIIIRPICFIITVGHFLLPDTFCYQNIIFSKYLPKRLWSFLVPCTVPSGSISR